MVRKSFLYVIVFAVTFVVALYVKFPCRETQDFVARRISGILGREVGVGDVTYRFPSSFILARPKCNITRDVVLEIEELHLRPDIRGLLNNEYSLAFSFDDALGKVSGRAMAVGQAGERRISVETEFEEVDISSHINEIMGLVLRGEFAGDLELSWQGLITDGNGSLAFRSDGGVVSDVDYLGMKMPDIRYEAISGEAVLTPGLLKLNKFSIIGPDIEVSGSGDFILAPRFGDSRMQITAEMEPSAGYLARVKVLPPGMREGMQTTCVIGGTFAAPDVRFSF